MNSTGVTPPPVAIPIDLPIYKIVAPVIWADPIAYDVGHLIGSLQAILNSDVPTVYVVFEKTDTGQSFWLNKILLSKDPLIAKRPVVELSDWKELLTKFRSQIDGAVVWDEDCYSCKNVAVTVAGADGRRLLTLRKSSDPKSVYKIATSLPSEGGFGIPVLVDLTSKFIGQGLIPDTQISSTGSKKCDAYLWAIEKYVKTGKINPTLAAYRLDGYWLYKTQTLRMGDVSYAFDIDYLIKNKAFVFDLDPWGDEIPLDDPTQSLGTDRRTLEVIYTALLAQQSSPQLIKTIGFPPFTSKYSSTAPAGPAGLKSNKLDWQTEWKTAEVASAFNSYLETDIEGTANTSFTEHLGKSLYRQNRAPSGASKKYFYDKGWISRTSNIVLKKVVLFTISDFDSASWMQIFLSGNLPPTPALWEDPQRGSLPLAWALTPQAADRIPQIFNYLYETKSANDFFVAPDSGAGYINPTLLFAPNKNAVTSYNVPDGINAWVAHNKKYYSLLDYSITNNIINGYGGPFRAAGPEILDRLVEFSPNGATYLGDSFIKDNPARLQNGMPYIAEGRSGFPEGLYFSSADNVASQIIQAFTSTKFAQFRTTLMPPSLLNDAAKIAANKDSDIVVVDPYSFFELLRIELGQDIVPPVCNFLINGGASTSQTRQVNLSQINYIDYPPNATGVIALRVSNDGMNWSELPLPGSRSEIIPWTLSSGLGMKTVYMQAKDAAGNWGNSDSSDNYCFSSVLLQ